MEENRKHKTHHTNLIDIEGEAYYKNVVWRESAQMFIAQKKGDETTMHEKVSMIISKSEREFILFLLGRYAEIMWEEIAWWSKKKKNMTTEWQNEKSVLSIEFAADIDSWFRGSSQVIIVEVFEDAISEVAPMVLLFS